MRGSGATNGNAVAKLVYSAITSLDGYIADANGNFDWAAPSEEVHAFVNELERPIGTYLYGRRMYDVMRFWETVDTNGSPQVIADYAQIWRGATKIVYSRTLEAVTTQRTRLERDFVPETIRELKTHAGQDISVGGAGLAAQAIAAGLVVEYQVFLTPIVVGTGTHWLPRGVRVELELQEERRFGSGVTFLRYHAKD